MSDAIDQWIYRIGELRNVRLTKRFDAHRGSIDPPLSSFSTSFSSHEDLSISVTMTDTSVLIVSRSKSETTTTTTSPAPPANSNNNNSITTPIYSIDGSDLSPSTAPGDSDLFTSSQMLLWLPHASIAMLLICLVTVSFVRFHQKHGHKYRKSIHRGPGAALVTRNAWLDDPIGRGLDSSVPGTSTSPPTQGSSTGPTQGDDGATGGEDWWNPERFQTEEDNEKTTSFRLSSPKQGQGRRGSTGGSVPGGSGQDTRVLFSVWTLRRSKVGDVVSLPKAISKPVRVSPGDCSTDECHELLLEKR